MNDMVWSVEQAEALARVGNFIRADNPEWALLILHGLAGTGKSTLLAHVARHVPYTALCCLTGKAASVLRDKTGLAACTIHSYFYRLAGQSIGEDGRKQLFFTPKHEEGQLWRALVFVDECSMVPESIGRQLMGTGAKVVAFGDPGQLPPVREAPFFRYPDFTLRQIHRQALESPIIRQALAVREGRPYRADGDDFQLVPRVLPAHVAWADMMLCWTNRTRHRLNAMARQLAGHTAPFPEAGEPVLCLKNAPLYDVWNGGIYTLARDYDPNEYAMCVMVEGVPVSIPGAIFTIERRGPIDDAADDATTEFDFGYALTTHKAQGSEWPRVLLVDEYSTREHRREWLYTALTRAARAIRVAREG